MRSSPHDDGRACAIGPEADTAAATAMASSTGTTKATMRSPIAAALSSGPDASPAGWAWRALKKESGGFAVRRFPERWVLCLYRFASY